MIEKKLKNYIKLFEKNLYCAFVIQFFTLFDKST